MKNRILTAIFLFLTGLSSSASELKMPISSLALIMENAVDRVSIASAFIRVNKPFLIKGRPVDLASFCFSLGGDNEAIDQTRRYLNDLDPALIYRFPRRFKFQEARNKMEEADSGTAITSCEAMIHAEDDEARGQLVDELLEQRNKIINAGVELVELLKELQKFKDQEATKQH